MGLVTVEVILRLVELFMLTDWVGVGRFDFVNTQSRD